jgi:hypothetical protein
MSPDKAMWNIGWRSIAIGVVYLLDLVVLGDLVRGEFSDMRARRVAVKRGQVRDRGPAAAYRDHPYT